MVEIVYRKFSSPLKSLESDGCSTDRLILSPVYKSSRLLFRPALLDSAKGDDFIYKAKHKEHNALRILYSPLEAFHKFANMHSSADAVAVSILEGVTNFNNKGFRKEVKLGTLDNYVIILHCLNSTLAPHTCQSTFGQGRGQGYYTSVSSSAGLFLSTKPRYCLLQDAPD